MQKTNKQPKIETNIGTEIRPDPDLKSAFDFWVRSIYLDRHTVVGTTSCEVLTAKDKSQTPNA